MSVKRRPNKEYNSTHNGAAISKNNASATNGSSSACTPQCDTAVDGVQRESVTALIGATTTANGGNEKNRMSQSVRAVEVEREKQSTRRLAIWSLLIAALSAGFTGMSYHEARETRLDALRSQIRSEALQELSNTRTDVAVFNCYAAIRGFNTLSGKEELQSLMDKLEPKIRASLNNFPNFDEKALLIFQQSLNETVGSTTRTTREALLKARVTWSKEDLERADEACKVETIQ